MRFTKPSITTALCCLIGLTGTAMSQEKPVKKADLPSAVQKTADEQSKGATVRGYSVEVEKGQKAYEVKMVANHHTKDVLIDPQGKVLEIEEEQDIQSLPTDVKESLERAASKAHIVKVESITKHDQLVAYEAVVQQGNKKKEIQVGPHGERLTHPE
jgi:hypothetical protein